MNDLPLMEGWSKRNSYPLLSFCYFLSSKELYTPQVSYITDTPRHKFMEGTNYGISSADQTEGIFEIRRQV